MNIFERSVNVFRILVYLLVTFESQNGMIILDGSWLERVCQTFFYAYAWVIERYIYSEFAAWSLFSMTMVVCKWCVVTKVCLRFSSLRFGIQTSYSGSVWYPTCSDLIFFVYDGWTHAMHTYTVIRIYDTLHRPSDDKILTIW